MQEDLSFSEEITEVTSLTSVMVNITRSGPACDTTAFFLNVLYNRSGMDSASKHMQSI